MLKYNSVTYQLLSTRKNKISSNSELDLIFLNQYYFQRFKSLTPVSSV